jgi:hypothetical protein
MVVFILFSSCIYEPALDLFIVIKNKTANEICVVYYKDSVISDRIAYDYVDKIYMNPDSSERMYIDFDRNNNIYYYFFDAKKLKERIQKKDTNGLVNISLLNKIKFIPYQVSSKDTFTLQ